MLPLVIPPLRERPEEIRDLIEHFAKVFCAPNKEPITFSAVFMDLMESYDWPGNVRELSNMVHRLSILYGGEELDVASIDPTMLPLGILEPSHQDSHISNVIEDLDRPDGMEDADKDLPPSTPLVVDSEFESIVMQAQGFGDFTKDQPSLKTMLGDIEQDLIVKALGEAGNVSRCAKLLKMQRTTLIERIKKYDLQTG